MVAKIKGPEGEESTLMDVSHSYNIRLDPGDVLEVIQPTKKGQRLSQEVEAVKSSFVQIVGGKEKQGGGAFVRDSEEPIGNSTVRLPLEPGSEARVIQYHPPRKTDILFE